MHRSHARRRGGRPLSSIVSTSGVLAVLALVPLAAADAAVVVADAVELEAMPAVRSGSAGAWAYQTRPLIVTQGGATRQPDDQVTPASAFTSVGDLIIGHGSGGARCTASRIVERTILTAAHCLADDFGTVTANAANVTFTTAAGLETHAIAGITQDSIHPLYTGDYVDGFDVAVLELASAPSSAVDTYGLLRDDSADVGAEFQVVGVGRSGTGAVGDTLASGTKRDGRNRFDAAGEVLEIVFSASAFRADSVLMFDFDNGDAANDAFGYFDPAFGLGLADTGLADEVNTASGDSGGPSFVGGRIAGVTSFGLRLAYQDGSTSDVDAVLNSSWGELSAAARVANPTVLAWIDQQMPAPATPLLLLAGLLAAAARRCR